MHFCTLRRWVGLICWCIGPSLPISAQILQGTIEDEEGDPLPFANVWVEGSATGCATNAEGFYSLELNPGDHNITVRYLGYATQRQQVSVRSGQVTEADFRLAPESLTLQDVVISGSEDPGMAIMRKAIAQRERYRRECTDFSVDAYVKSLQKIDEAPDRILGIRIDGGDVLDSNNAGIVYLSESYSRLHVKNAGSASRQTREEMLASKVSGDAQGFSWNEAAPMEISFYEPRLDIAGVSERHFVSPLADDAFLFYRFSLAGTIVEDGSLINKIAVIPRRNQDPVFRGFLYIIEDSWRIYATDLFLTRDAGIEFIDSLSVSMTYQPVDSLHWMPVSRQFRFRFRILGIRGGGYFMAFYRNYQIQPVWEKRRFGPEVLSIEQGANEMDSSYWADIRPIPLSPVEIKDYREKEILERKRESREYLDSLDRQSNKLQVTDFLLGYTHENSFKESRWYWESPLNTIGFNTVEGWYGSLSGGWNKQLERNRVFRLKGQVRYGTGNGRLQADGQLQWVQNPIHFQRLDLAGGKTIRDYHPDAVSGLVNSLYTLLLERNYLKLYESRYAEAGFTRQLFNGFRAHATVHWSHRIPLRNTTPNAWIDRESEVFLSNDPLKPLSESWPFEANYLSRFNLSLRYQIAQRYATEPDRRYNLGSKWPLLRLHYSTALPVAGSSWRFQRAEGLIEYTADFGLWGKTDLLAIGGGFLQADSISFLDYQHFRGNQTVVLRTELRRFNTLPYFSYSTRNAWVEGHADHHFNGFLFNKIPGIRKLRWQAVAGTHILYTSDRGLYTEISAGIEHIFKVLRVDFAAGWGDGDPNYAVLFGIGF